MFFVVVKGHSVAIIASLSAIAGVAVIGIVAVILCRQSRKSKGQRSQSSVTHTRYEISLTLSIQLLKHVDFMYLRIPLTKGISVVS